MSGSRHVPPLGFHALTGLYDAVVARTMPETEFRARIVERARPQPDERVLDLGCGTGELTLAVLANSPGARVTALDPDQAALAIATRKFGVGDLSVRALHGTSDHPGLERGGFDLVVSSLVLHHLSTPTKSRVLGELFLLLRPGGRVVIGDWAPARSFGDRLRFLPVRVLDGFGNTRANARGELPELLAMAGLVDVVEGEPIHTVFGPLSVLTARRPDG